MNPKLLKLLFLTVIIAGVLATGILVISRQLLRSGASGYCGDKDYCLSVVINSGTSNIAGCGENNERCPSSQKTNKYGINVGETVSDGSDTVKMISVDGDLAQVSTSYSEGSSVKLKLGEPYVVSSYSTADGPWESISISIGRNER
ncbi:hypothetical protein FACS189431_7180 [Alphaproteobacteria bacterium]|nr:hypothetical protein FACS189431_7180 [Alphaproteobacteria bacterium]